MLRSMLKSKIHRAIVTETDLNYEGSIAIDKDLMKAAGLMAFEVVNIFDVHNGERFETYVIEGESGYQDHHILQRRSCGSCVYMTVRRPFM